MRKHELKLQKRSSKVRSTIIKRERICPDEESLDPNIPLEHLILPLLEGLGTFSECVCCFSPLWDSLTAG